MSKSNPLVSVVMPAYNAEKYISEAIESILNQTFKDFEFIIIDDGSTDRTWEIIQEYAKKDKRIVAVKNKKNLKICKTLNKGIEKSKGKYIIRMDSDDWSYPYRIERQVGFLNKNPDVVVCGSAVEISDQNLKLIHVRKYPKTDSDIRKKIFLFNPFAHPSVAIRLETLKFNTIYYNDLFYDAEDYDLYFRLGKYGKLRNLDEVLLKYRISDDSVSHKRHLRQGLLTMKIRLKAIFQYDYKISLFHLLMQPLILFSILLLPVKIKYKLFIFLRKYFL